MTTRIHCLFFLILLTLGLSDVDAGAVVLDDVGLLDALELGQAHLLKNATQLLVVWSWVKREDE
jgi:hypothetical protein